ncbi:type II secretion system F family protein [Opitutales bacterium]|nr:type II secretion system F family protein [bacterium]MDA7757082.1 type II secretion system F family protein [Opitutales bacterium]MDA8990515.1 type II secretion system F family protein [Opitutales bacterium]
MREFKYVAITQRGKSSSGVISAKNTKEAKEKLVKDGLRPLKISSAGKHKKSSSKSASNDSSGEKQKSVSIAKGSQKGERLGLEFLKRLHELHGSGMPIAESVKLLNLRLSDPYQKEIAASLWKELAEGRTLSRAMRLLPQYFSESSTFVVEAGEATGNLAPILAKIILHLEEKRDIRSKVLSSMTYPIFVGVVAFGVVLFFLFFLLPQIQEMLDSLGGELNMMAKILINGSNLVLTIGPFVVVAMLVGGGALYRWSKTEKGGVVFDQNLLRVPLFGEIIYLSELFQLSSLLATLIWSGIGLTENLRLCEKTIRNRFLRNQFRSARALVNEGRSLPDSLRKFRFMPLMQLDVIEVGEKTGNLGNSMEDTSRSFKDQLTKKIKTMTTLVSGAALGFAFSLVALVAISIVTSIFQVSKSISY